jgi:hypothetical protein
MLVMPDSWMMGRRGEKLTMNFDPKYPNRRRPIEEPPRIGFYGD